MTNAELFQTVTSAIYLFVAFAGGVYIGYLFGFNDGNNNF